MKLLVHGKMTSGFMTTRAGGAGCGVLELLDVWQTLNFNESGRWYLNTCIVSGLMPRVQVWVKA